MSQAGGWGVGAGRPSPGGTGGVPVGGGGKPGPVGPVLGVWGEADGVG